MIQSQLNLKAWKKNPVIVRTIVPFCILVIKRSVKFDHPSECRKWFQSFIDRSNYCRLNVWIQRWAPCVILHNGTAGGERRERETMMKVNNCHCFNYSRLQYVPNRVQRLWGSALKLWAADAVNSCSNVSRCHFHTCSQFTTATEQEHVRLIDMQIAFMWWFALTIYG